MRPLLAFAFGTLLIAGCSPLSKRSLTRTFRDTENKFKEHTGFMLYDLEKRKSIYEYNAATYFTPASNTKIFTLFTALSLIGDSIPGLYYQEIGDSLNVWGTGDPSSGLPTLVQVGPGMTTPTPIRPSDQLYPFTAMSFTWRESIQLLFSVRPTFGR
jgi:D-alanyl-D-alanine carboxypeptidase